jgi:glycosyltransferase involved in cell wall biosynthesis
VPSEKVHVVGLGANHAVTGDLGRDWSRPRFLFIGWDWERKNGPMLLTAFARVRERFPDATLDLVGRHPRVDQEGVFAHGARPLNDHAERAYVENLYRTATAFVLPSVHEPSGTVHIEAASAGIASIGTTNGGAATCIGDAGFLVDPSEPERLVEAMCELAIPETAKALGERAARRAKLFTWRKVAERLVRALEIPGVDATELAEFL